MSLNFSANQRPRTFEGFSQIVANRRGHLLPGVKRSRTSPWGPFVGTWDLPKQLPAIPMAVKTARTQPWAEHLKLLKTSGDEHVGGKYKIFKFNPEKGYKAGTGAVTNKTHPSHPLDPVTDAGLNEPAYPPDIPDQPKSPAQVYQYPPKPKIKTDTPTPREKNRNKVERVDPEAQNTNRNATSMSGCEQRMETPGSRRHVAVISPHQYGSRPASDLSTNKHASPHKTPTPTFNTPCAIRHPSPRGTVVKTGTPLIGDSRPNTGRKSPPHRADSIRRSAMENPQIRTGSRPTSVIECKE